MSGLICDRERLQLLSSTFPSIQVCGVCVVQVTLHKVWQTNFSQAAGARTSVRRSKSMSRRPRLKPVFDSYLSDPCKNGSEICVCGVERLKLLLAVLSIPFTVFLVVY